MPLNSDTIQVSRDLHLMQVSEMLNVPIEQLRDMNPQYLRDVIPARGGIKYPLRLPAEAIGKFIDNEQQIYAYKDSVFFNPADLEKMVTNSRGTGFRPGNNFTRTRYIVKQGETLGGLAQRFNCSINDIKDWNDMYRNRIRVGQKLTIYTPKKKGGKAEKAQVNNDTKETSGVDKVTYHKVNSGDSLWEVAQAYGVKVDDICKWNNMSPESKLMTGTKIKICL
jgi:membrane-bound lytic murein transglycosylase D